MGYLKVFNSIFFLGLLFSGFSAHGETAQCPDGAMVNITDLGANGEDKSDDSEALQQAFNCLSEKKSGVVYIPPGTFYFDKKIIFVSQRAKNLSGLTIKGDGVGVSNLVSRNSEGVIDLRYMHRNAYVHVKNLSFDADIAHAGTAFSMSQVKGGMRHNRSLIMEHVRFGFNFTTLEDQHYFDWGINLSGIWRPLLNDLTYTGYAGMGMNLRTSFPAKGCFNLEENYGYLIKDSHCWGANVGLQAIGTEVQGPEGGIIDNVVFVNVGTGVVIKNIGQEPGFLMKDSHVNAIHRGVILEGKKLGEIRNVLFYSERSLAYQDILLNNSSKIIIKDNTFYFGDKPNRAFVRVVNSASVDNVIRHNRFEAPGYISFAHGTRAKTVIDESNTFKHGKKVVGN